MEVCDMINDIIVSTRGPYMPFQKKINLADLASIVEEIWDDQDDWRYAYFNYDSTFKREKEKESILYFLLIILMSLAWATMIGHRNAEII